MKEPLFFKYLLAPFRFLYKIYFALAFFVTMLLLYPLLYWLVMDEKRHETLFKLKIFWAWIFHIITFNFFIVKGKKNFPDPPFVAVANHSSYVDTPFMYKVVKTHFKFMAKAEMMNWPLFGIFFKKGSDIPVFRKDKEKASWSLKQADNALKQGISVVLFPEGTIPWKSPQMKDFKSGAFKIAIQNQVPIVPITFLSNWKRMGEPIHFTSKGSPGLSKVIVHQPLNTKGLMMDELTELREKAREIIIDPLRKLDRAV